MNIDAQENFIEDQRNSNAIDSEMNNLLDTEEGQHIKADIELLNSMGFDGKMINKVYILLGPANIERAIDYMTELDGVFQHDFISSSNNNENNLCFICKKPPKNHLDYIPENLLVDAQNNNLNNNNIGQNEVNIDEDNLIFENNQNNNNKNDIKDNDDFNFEECQVCFEELSKEDIEYNKIKCEHIFCTNCWFNYLKTSIQEAKVDDIKCMDHECNQIVSEDFILKHISDNENLIDKYKKFKKRSEIIKDKNKKLCPNPDCDSFLLKSKSTNYVTCENGHKYCFECLKPPHGKQSCDYNLEKQFMNWTKGKRVKRCPRCQMFTEKNEGCNHMTCVNCKYQWCWLCEGQYIYGHYDSGKCAGHQFTKADNLEEIKNIRVDNYNHEWYLGINEDVNYCGLHKIFGCTMQPIREPFEFDDIIWAKYLLMFGFLIFGFMLVFWFGVNNYHEGVLQQSISGCTYGYLIIISLGMGFVLLVPFQIAFACLISPFILISIFYHKFFDKLLLFFEIGGVVN